MIAALHKHPPDGCLAGQVSTSKREFSTTTGPGSESPAQPMRLMEVDNIPKF